MARAGSVCQLRPQDGPLAHTAGFYIVDSRGILRYYVRPSELTPETAPDLAGGLYRVVLEVIGEGQS